MGAFPAGPSHSCPLQYLVCCSRHHSNQRLLGLQVRSLALHCIRAKCVLPSLMCLWVCAGPESIMECMIERNTCWCCNSYRLWPAFMQDLDGGCRAEGGALCQEDGESPDSAWHQAGLGSSRYTCFLCCTRGASLRRNAMKLYRYV